MFPSSTTDLIEAGLNEAAASTDQRAFEGPVLSCVGLKALNGEADIGAIVARFLLNRGKYIFVHLQFQILMGVCRIFAIVHRAFTSACRYEELEKVGAGLTTPVMLKIGGRHAAQVTQRLRM